MDNLFKILKIGQLKYDRLKCLSILRKEFQLFDIKYNIIEIKTIFDNILIGKFHEKFDRTFKYCLDCVFNKNEYITYNFNEIETNFSENIIMPTG
jgi:hypothetical protein